METQKNRKTFTTARAPFQIRLSASLKPDSLPFHRCVVLKIGDPFTRRLTFSPRSPAQFKPPIAPTQQMRFTKTHHHFAVPPGHTIHQCFQFHAPTAWHPR